MSYPSTYSSFNRPTTNDRLNSPSHSDLHNTTSSAVGQIEQVVGLNTGANASAVGTLMYDIRSIDSNGGGHVQTANKGGTGQTSYIKGDLLVATSSSVLAKLSVGNDGLQLVADSSVAAGIKWTTPPGNKVFVSGSTFGLTQNVENSIFSTTVSGSTLGTNGAVKALSYINIDSGLNASILTRAFYGGNQVASILLTSTGPTVSVVGEFKYILIGNGAQNLQRVVFQALLSPHKTSAQTPSSIIAETTFGTSSVNSSANQTMGVTWITSADLQPKIMGTIVEKTI